MQYLLTKQMLLLEFKMPRSSQNWHGAPCKKTKIHKLRTTKKKNIYTNILNDTDFTNVTLACDYGKQLRAHNVILSASSPYLRNILLNDHQNNALINLRGVYIEDLQLKKFCILYYTRR